MSLKTKVILMVILAVLIISIPIIRLLVKRAQVTEAQIPDTNGESKELCRITDEHIEQTTEWSDMIKHRRTYDSSNKSGVKNAFEDKDVCYSRETAKSFSGVYICNAFLSSGRSVKYTVDSKVNSGNLKIVITDESNKILYNVPIDTTHYVELPTQEGQIYYVKLVGESADMVVSVNRNG